MVYFWLLALDDVSFNVAVRLVPSFLADAAAAVGCIPEVSVRLLAVIERPSDGWSLVRTSTSVVLDFASSCAVTEASRTDVGAVT